MADLTQVVLYGSSLYMAGLAVSLGANPWLDVTHIPSGFPATKLCFDALTPAAVVVDLNEISAEQVLSHLRTYPRLMLIGVDLTSEDILFVSGRHIRIVTMTDMIRLIEEAIGGHRISPPADESAAESG